MKAKAAAVVRHLAAALEAAEAWRRVGNATLVGTEEKIEDLMETWHDAARGIV